MLLVLRDEPQYLLFQRFRIHVTERWKTNVWIRCGNIDWKEDEKNKTGRNKEKREMGRNIQKKEKERKTYGSEKIVRRYCKWRL